MLINPEKEHTNAPEFLEQLRDITIHEGQDVCFKTKVTGIPQPDIKWFKDGNLISETANIKVRLSLLIFILD